MITPWQKEWESLTKKEQAYLRRGAQRKASALGYVLAGKVPPKLQSTLNTAFSKAFRLIFEKGTVMIEKTYKRDEAERQFKVNCYAIELKEDRKGLRQFAKQAGWAGQGNLLLSGLEGIGLGVLGIGLPDIPLFTAMLLKSVYEIALHYGCGYDSPEEKHFILQLIQTSLSYGDELVAGNLSLNAQIETGPLPEASQDAQLERTAAALSMELLCMKFLQGIPLLGAVGGLYNPICLQKVQSYARLKYARRFLYGRRPNAATL